MNIIKSLITVSIQRPVCFNQHLKKLVSANQFNKLTFCRPVSTVKDDLSSDYSLVPNQDVSVSERPSLPLITKRDLPHHTGFTKPRQAWLENLDILDLVHLGTVDLHPLIFACSPRLDILHINVEWQRAYHRMSHKRTPTRGEMVGGSRKPWPQKGSGRARHGSTNSPLWYNGAKAHGPRGPKTWYFMPSFFVRLKGLTTALSMKLAQDDLHIIDSLEIPTDDSKYLENLVEHRGWGPSVLFVDAIDVAPRNFAVAVSNVKHINIMPVYGLNVFSMLKHDTLVLTLAALEQIEERILFQLFRRDVQNIGKCKVTISP